MKSTLLLSLWLSLAFGGAAVAQTAEAPADLISNFRLQHGEGRVMLDPTLTRIAHEQAAAMAGKDVLSHEVLGQFSSRIAAANAGRAAENIAYGYDSFPKTLKQWIEFVGTSKEPVAAQCVTVRHRQREKLGERPNLLVDGNRRRL